MGYAVYQVGDRDAGYGVPAVCDHPGCNERIDRGLSYICGGEPASDSRGCNLYFCSEHLQHHFARQNGAIELVPLCARCYPRRKKPFPPKPDLPEWLEWKLQDESWQQWRDENPAEVQRIRDVLSHCHSEKP